jgi:hypothetical protein
MGTLIYGGAVLRPVRSIPDEGADSSLHIVRKRLIDTLGHLLSVGHKGRDTKAILDLQNAIERLDSVLSRFERYDH